MNIIREHVIKHWDTKDYLELFLPQFAKILSVKIQDDQLYMWVLVNDELPETQRKFIMARTGDPIEEDLRNLTFIDTHRHKGLVFHFFEILE